MFMLLRSQAYWFQIHSSPFLLYWVSGELATAVYQVSRSSDSVSVGSLGPDVDKVLFEPSKHLWQVWGLILNAIFPLLPSCWGFSFALGCGVPFFMESNILLSMVIQQWVTIFGFLQEKMSTCPPTPPSCVWVRPVFESPAEVWVSSSLPQGQGLWVQQTCGISPPGRGHH